MATKQYDAYADLITFSRASTGTYLDSDGLLKTASTNVPRIEYDASGTRKGLLIEEARTNLDTASESTAGYVVNAGTLTTNEGSWTGGATNAHKHVGSGASNSHYVAQGNVSYSSGSIYAKSLFVKPVGSQRFLRMFYSGAFFPTNERSVCFDLVDGVVADEQTNTKGFIQALGSGWYRCTIIATASATGSDSHGWALQGTATANPQTTTIPVTDGILLQGSQVEAGSFPTSYIPTSGSTATRSADVASIPTSAFGDNQKAGTVIIDATSAAGGSKETLLTGVKGFFLSDTDDTDLVGSGELWDDTGVTVGNNWTDLGGGSYQHTDGDVDTLRDDLGLVSGKLYVLEYTVSGRTSGSVYPVFGGSVNGTSVNTNGTFTDTKVSGVNSLLYFQPSSNFNGTISAVSIKLADADRSVNNNGLIVNGTVTRSPVATGAELVGYSGFSASNYLEQPYNSDLDFGTGDFCVMGWFNHALSANTQYLVMRGDGSSAPKFQVGASALNDLLIAMNGNIYARSAASVYSDNTWNHVVVTRTASGTAIYLNGRLLATGGGSAENVTDTAAKLYVGDSPITNPFNGSLALFRISATAPTADEIRNIYETERDFFQENASYTVPSVSDYTLDTPQKFFQFDDGTVSDRLTVERDAVGNLQVIQSDDGAGNLYYTVGALANGDQAKFGIAYDSKSINTSLNGSTAISNVTSSVPSFTTIRLGSGIKGLSLSSHIKSITYYPRRLTNTQLQELTS